MRVLINGMVLCGKKTGIGHYAAELIRCLDPLLGKGKLTVYRPAWVESARRLLVKMRPAGGPTSSGTSGGLPRAQSAQRMLRGWAVNRMRDVGKMAYHMHFRRTARQGYALYHEPNFLPLECGLPTVTTVHDLSVLLHPEWHPADRVAEHERDFARGLAVTQHIIAGSEFTRQEIIRHLGLSPDRITRVYYGIRPGLCPLPAADIEIGRRQLNLPPRYLLYLGTIEPRKNLMTLLRAYCSLPEPVRQKYPLVLAGGWGWNSEDVARFLHEEARHRGVLYLGYLPDELMAVVYNGARALVFPSHYEGFGLPPVEMMACSGAVLASTAGSIVEAVGSKAHLTHPDDLDGWREAMLRVCTDDDWWMSLRQGAEAVARPFTWERCAADTLAAYQRVLQVGQPVTRRAA